MEHPPLIDVEPEENGKTKQASFEGCLRRLILIALFLFFLTLITALGGYFYLKNKYKNQPLEERQKGLSGLVHKVKKALGGGSGENSPSNGRAPLPLPTGEAASLNNEVDGLSEKEPEQETSQAGVVSENNASENGTAAAPQSGNASAAPVRRQSRGGSAGSSSGPMLGVGGNGKYRKWRGNLKTSGSDLEFEIIFQEAGGQIQYRCFLLPYDPQSAQLFRADKGDFLLSFADGQGRRLVPATDDLTIPLTNMSAFENKGTVAGWVARGTIPLDGQAFSNLETVKLGWNFDKDLSDWLKHLPDTR